MAFTGFVNDNLPSLVFDDFTRADSGTLGSGWTEGNRPIGGTGLQIISNRIGKTVANNEDTACRTAIASNSIAICMDMPVFATGDVMYLAVNSTDPRNLANNAGYIFYINAANTIDAWYSMLNSGGAFDDGTDDTLSQSFASGDTYGITLVDNGVSVVVNYFRRAGAAGNWSNVGSRTMVNYIPGPYQPSFGIFGSTTARVDNVRADIYDPSSLVRAYDPVPFWDTMPGVRLALPSTTIYTGNTTPVSTSNPAQQPVVNHEAKRRKVLARAIQRNARAKIVRPPLSGLPASSYTPTVKHVYVLSKALRNRLNPRAISRNQALVVKPTYRQPAPPVRTTTAVYVYTTSRATLVRALQRNSRTRISKPKQPLGSTRTTTRIVIRQQTRNRAAQPRAAARNQAQVVKPPLRGVVAVILLKTILPIYVRMTRKSRVARAVSRKHGAIVVRPKQPFGSTRTQPRQVIRVTRTKAVVRANKHTPQAIIVRPSFRPQIVTLKTIKAVLVKVTRRRHWIAALRRNQRAKYERSTGGTNVTTDLSPIVCDTIAADAVVCDAVSAFAIADGAVVFTPPGITNDTLTATGPSNDTLTSDGL